MSAKIAATHYIIVSGKPDSDQLLCYPLFSLYFIKLNNSNPVKEDSID